MTDSPHLELYKPCPLPPFLLPNGTGRGLDGWAVRGVRNWLDGSVHGCPVNGSISKMKPVTSGGPQGLCWGQYNVTCDSGKIPDPDKVRLKEEWK